MFFDLCGCLAHFRNHRRQREQARDFGDGGKRSIHHGRPGVYHFANGSRRHWVMAPPWQSLVAGEAAFPPKSVIVTRRSNGIYRHHESARALGVTRGTNGFAPQAWAPTLPTPGQTDYEENSMLTMASRCLDSDRVSAASVAMPPVLPDEMPLEPLGMSPVGQSRTLTEVRTRRLLETRIDFVSHPSFDDPATHSMILNPPPAISRGREVARVKPPAGVSWILEGIYSDPLLTREQEVHMFRKMNFLKHQASRFRGAINPTKVTDADLDLVEALQAEALEVRNQIIRANLRLVASLVKKLCRDDHVLAELVSDGYVAMMRAVERFDFSRGYKFSTYASWVIINSALRDSARDHRRDRLRTGTETLLEAAPDYRSDEFPRDVEQEHCRDALCRMLVRLNDRERKIIVSRFGLEGTCPKTLNQLGKELGITKERVRQLENRAREKLREIAEAQKFDPTAF